MKYIVRHSFTLLYKLTLAAKITFILFYHHFITAIVDNLIAMHPATNCCTLYESIIRRSCIFISLASNNMDTLAI